MSLIVWFRNGKLKRATVCRNRSTETRIANSFNEYAEAYNQRGHGKNIVGVIPEKLLFALVELVGRHRGLPKHTPLERLEAKRKEREAQRPQSKVITFRIPL